MAHRLRITLEGAAVRQRSWEIDFNEAYASRLEAVLGDVSQLPRRWDESRFETDAIGSSWSASGVREQLAALVVGCREHGWPFVAYARARAYDDHGTWVADYSTTYLGWWPNRRSFAQELAESGAHFIEEGATGDLDQITINEICSGFLCIDVDDRVAVFDEPSAVVET